MEVLRAGNHNGGNRGLWIRMRIVRLSINSTVGHEIEALRAHGCRETSRAAVTEGISTKNRVVR